MTAWARGALVALLAVVLAACTLDLDVRVDVRPDGSGSVEVEVEVDAGALARVGGDLAAVVDLDRLRAEGWSVDGPAPTAQGGAALTLRQGFADPADADRVLGQLAGGRADSPFRNLQVKRKGSLLRTRWRFGGTIDLDNGLALPGVTPGGAGDPLSSDVDLLERQLGDSLDRLLRVRIGVRLPGDVRSNATTKADNGAVWQVRFGDGPLDLDATGTRTRTSTVVLGAVGVLLVLVAVVWLLVRLAIRRTADPGQSAGRR